MTKPVQVTFRNMSASSTLERKIRERADWLETFYSGIVGCRVLIELPHRHRAKGRPIHVRLEVSLPGEDVIVNRLPTLHASLKDLGVKAVHKETELDDEHRNAVSAIYAAFDMARRRLEDVARQQRGDVKLHRHPRPA